MMRCFRLLKKGGPSSSVYFRKRFYAFSWGKEEGKRGEALAFLTLDNGLFATKRIQLKWLENQKGTGNCVEEASSQVYDMFAPHMVKFFCMPTATRQIYDYVFAFSL